MASSAFLYKQEVEDALNFMKSVYETFGFTYKLYLATRPDKYMGELSQWDESESVTISSGVLLLTLKIIS